VLILSITVTNEGEVAGSEVAQLYLEYVVAFALMAAGHPAPILIP